MDKEATIALKPIIGITPSWEKDHLILKHAYTKWIVAAGGLPVVIPFIINKDDI